MKNLVFVVLFCLIGLSAFGQANHVKPHHAKAKIVRSPTVPIQGVPPGMTFVSGVLSGTPSPGSYGTYQFTVSACDSEVPPQCATPAVATVIVTPSPVVIGPIVFPSGMVGVPYAAQQVMITGGIPPYNVTAK